MNSPMQISQQTIHGLWSVRANANHDLNHFSNSLFGQSIQFGEMIASDGLRLVQLWPGAVYLFSQQTQLPAATSEYENMITDISHGFSNIQLIGDSVLPFLNNYCSADLEQADITARQCLRTSLGHYPIIIWWNSVSEVQLLVDRSYAQSLSEFLTALALRH